MLSFGSNSTDGKSPLSYLIVDASGNLYGTASEGGYDNSGIVFELIPRANGGWREKVLHRQSPGANEGIGPQGALVFDSAGNLYGTAASSGPGNSGTVFKLTPLSDGTWQESTIYAFHGPAVVGSIPGSLILDSKGNLLGTTTYGGTNSAGTVFKLSPAADGTWAYTLLHEFEGLDTTDGAFPVGSLTLDATGNIYGSTTYGGANSRGTVFELSPSGASFHYRVLYNFLGGDTDGANPNSNVIFDAEGNLYGSTTYGGAGLTDFGGAGTVFKLTPSAAGDWAESILYSFMVNNSLDGLRPLGRLLFDHSGNLYGTTYQGGTACSCGIIFELRPQNGLWTEKVLHNFDEFSSGSDGYEPWGGLIMDSRGNLYGTTVLGGTYGQGTVFALRP